MPAAARLGDKAQVSADAHGCPSCPHPAQGPIVVGSPDVFINKKPAARQDDLGIHAICCGPNNFSIVKGSPTVYVNNKPLARQNDKTKHCGGTGPITAGSPNVLIDDGAAAAGALAAIQAAARAIATEAAAAFKKGQAKKHADQHKGSGGRGGAGGAGGAGGKGAAGRGAAGAGGDLSKDVAKAKAPAPAPGAPPPVPGARTGAARGKGTGTTAHGKGTLAAKGKGTGAPGEGTAAAGKGTDAGKGTGATGQGSGAHATGAASGTGAQGTGAGTGAARGTGANAGAGSASGTAGSGAQGGGTATTPAPGTSLELAWSTGKGSCGDRVTLSGTTNLPDGTAVAVTLKAQQGSSQLPGFSASVAGGKLVHEWTIADVDFGAGVQQAFVEVEASAPDAAATTNTATLRVEALSDAPSRNFQQNRSWSGFSVNAHFAQKLEKFRDEVAVTFNLLKGWGGTYVDMRPAGITGTAGGCPFEGHRWGRSSSPRSMAPDQYYDGTAWKPLPAGFVVTAASYQAIGFYKSGNSFICTSGGSYPNPFADYDFNSAAYTQRRSDWISDTHRRWTEAFALRRHGCTSVARVHCCKHDVEVNLTLNVVASYGAGVVLCCAGPLRSNAITWFMDDDRIAVCAHEAGHYMDNPDEYQNGAVDTSLNGDGAVHGIDANNIMGQNLSVVKKRHYHAFAKMAQELVNAAYGRNDPFDVVDR